MLKISQLEGKIFKVEAQIREAKKAQDTELLESLSLENAQLRQELEDRRRLETEVAIMVNECSAIYATKNCNQINAWLENVYNPFRTFWLTKVDEDTFAETWNRINRASK